MSRYASAPPPPSPAPPLPDDAFSHLGALDRYAVRGDTLFAYSGEACLAVTRLADDLLRIRFTPTGTFAEAEPFSYALDPATSWPRGPLTVEDRGDHVLASTGRVHVRLEKAAVRLAFYTPDGRLLDADTDGIGWTETEDGVHLRCTKRLHDDQRFFGLGDKTFPIDRRGHTYTMWNSDTYAYAPEQDPIYKSIPFFLSLHDGGRAGFGLFFDNTYRSFFDLGDASPDAYRFGAEGGEFCYYFFAGPDPKSILARYTDLTGRKPMPPRWALGYHQSRWNYHDDGYALWIAHEFRRRDIPLECIHLDIAYMDGYRVFTWDENRFPDPKRLTAQLAELGVKTVLIIDPGVKVDPGYAVYDEGAERGYFHTNPTGAYHTDTVWPGDVHWPDFSNPDARAWWGAKHKRHLDEGIRGFWNDMNEPAVLGGNTLPDDIRFDWDGRGTDHLEGHNAYGLLMARATHEGVQALRPEERPFLLTRACYAGSQRYGAGWTGDNVSTWEHLRLSLSICLSLSASGMAFCGPDIGGFAGQPTPELYARWMQAGVFYPFMRTHYSHEEIDQQEPWSFGPEVEKICRKYIGLRYKLMPYIYTAFVEAHRTGLPPMRMLPLHHPTDPHSHDADDVFYFGPALLVAPVVEEGARERAVYLPEGTWFDFWSNERHDGQQTIRVAAPLGHLPLFARGGQTIPAQPYMRYTDEYQPQTLVLKTYPGEGTSTFYDDDGQSYAYRNGDYHALTISIQPTDEGYELTLGRDGARGLPHQRIEWQIPVETQHYPFVDSEPVPHCPDPDTFSSNADGCYYADGLLRIHTRTDVRHLRLVRADRSTD